MSAKHSAAATKTIKSVKGASINAPSSTATKKSRKYNGPVIHNIDAVTKWVPVMGHPCFELGFIEECNVPHTPLHLKYPYPIRHIESGHIVRITPKYFEDYVKIMLDHKPINIHRLYMSTLHPVYAAGMVVDHIDRNTHNNLLSNLRWATVSENNKNKAKRDKYFRTLVTEELPEKLRSIPGTNALIDDDELYVYTPIGNPNRHTITEYREFDLSLDTVEISIRPSGELKVHYNPKIARTDNGLYISASRLLYMAKVPYERICDIKKRRKLIKSPEYLAKIQKLINSCAFVKCCSDKFIFEWEKIENTVI